MPKFPSRPRARSNCWYYYTRCEVGGKCRLCGKEVRSTGCTTNLLNHLKRKHREHFSEGVACPESIEAVSFLENENAEEHGEDANEQVQESPQSPPPEGANHIVESEGSHPVAYQTEEGNTVIWLQSADGQEASFQPQITIVQHSTPEHSENTHSGETILSNGEVVPNPSAKPLSEEPKITTVSLPLKKDHVMQSSVRKKVTNSNSVKLAQRNSLPSPFKLVRTSPSSKNVELTKDGEDTYDHFGKYIASLLRNLCSKKTACRLQKEMIWLVLQEQIRTEDS